MACACFRFLILVRPPVGLGEAGSKYGSLEKTLQTQIQDQAGYVREERQGVRGRYMFAVEHRMGECCLKTWTLEEEGSGWNPTLTIY